MGCMIHGNGRGFHFTVQNVVSPSCYFIVFFRFENCRILYRISDKTDRVRFEKYGHARAVLWCALLPFTTVWINPYPNGFLSGSTYQQSNIEEYVKIYGILKENKIWLKRTNNKAVWIFHVVRYAQLTWIAVISKCIASCILPLNCIKLFWQNIQAVIFLL